MLKKKVATAAAITLLAPAAIIAAAGPAAAAPRYGSCDQLTAKFPHGVAKSPAAAQLQVDQGYGRPDTSKLAKRVYAKNKGRLDRDKDGTACER